MSGSVTNSVDPCSTFVLKLKQTGRTQRCWVIYVSLGSCLISFQLNKPLPITLEGFYPSFRQKSFHDWEEAEVWEGQSRWAAWVLNYFKAAIRITAHRLSLSCLHNSDTQYVWNLLCTCIWHIKPLTGLYRLHEKHNPCLLPVSGLELLNPLIQNRNDTVKEHNYEQIWPQKKKGSN